MSKQTWVAIAIALVVVVVVAILWRSTSAGIPTIGIAELLEHPDVAAVTQGIRDELAERGFRDAKDIRIIVHNAQGQNNLLLQIYNDFKARGVDIVVPIFTTTAQSAKNEFPNKPIVFAAVTDPVGAGLVPTLERPGGNVTGVSDLWPIDLQLKLIREIVPTANRIGVLYNPGEQQSAFTFDIVKMEAAKLGLEIVPAAVSSSNDVLTAASSLKGRCDVFYTANDVTVAGALEAVISFCQENQIPFFAGDASAVKRGAIATYGQSYYGVGKLAGELVARVLYGENPGDIPIVISKEVKLHINQSAASAMGLTLPDNLKQSDP